VTDRFNKGEEHQAEQEKDRQDTKRSDAAQGQRFAGDVRIDFHPRLSQKMTMDHPAQPSPPTAPDPHTTPSRWERWRRRGAFIGGFAAVASAAAAVITLVGRALGWFG
jgi:hypothetical protein